MLSKQKIFLILAILGFLSIFLLNHQSNYKENRNLSFAPIVFRCEDYPRYLECPPINDPVCGVSMVKISFEYEEFAENYRNQCLACLDGANRFSLGYCKID